MRLDELKPSQAKKIMSDEFSLPEIISNFLKENGYEQVVGTNNFADVFVSSNSNIVVKIGTRETDYDGWLPFAKFAQDNPNKHFPKIGSIKVVRNNRGIKFYVAFMEKLHPVQGYDIDQVRHILSQIAQEVRYTSTPKLSKVLKRMVLILSRDPVWRRERLPVLEKLVKNDLSLLKAVVDIQKNLPNYSPDFLNEKNYMMRKDGTLVITDPLGWKIKGF